MDIENSKDLLGDVEFEDTSTIRVPDSLIDQVIGQDESVEIIYLKNGINGFVVPRGKYVRNGSKTPDFLGQQCNSVEFSDAAKREIA